MNVIVSYYQTSCHVRVIYIKPLLSPFMALCANNWVEFLFLFIKFMLLITKCNCLKKYKLWVFVRPCSSKYILLEHDMRFGNKKRLHSFKEINAKVWWQIQRSKSLTINNIVILLSTFNNFSHIFWGPSWSCSYGGWIYNYLCNQCLSPLKLWVRTPFIARCTRYNINW
jgi:hypothetical protein